MAAAAAGTDEARIIHALNVMCRMDPARVGEDAARVASLLGEDAGEDFLETVDRPLAVAKCASTGKTYIKCDYNRDGDSHRSPWSNTYDPPVEAEDGEEAFVPPAELRKTEVAANELLSVYGSQYYGSGAATSAYLWDQDGGSIAGCFLVRKDIEGGRHVKSATWNSINVVEATPSPAGEGQFVYRLTSSLVLQASVVNDEVGTVSLSGTLTRKTERTQKPEGAAAVGPDASKPDHIAVWGGMIEAMESSMHSLIENVVVAKSATALSASRQAGSSGPAPTASFVASLNAAVVAHGTKRSALDK
ncbi:hypothetical protein FNF29_02420 [Cafeteria roenbergensis]|nr:hypothetical protein FNF29_02420 [Cafeteria roenbergensis]KAA0159414.1 hypothetical protein FNF28_05885 [Cafeteria roenbergensis]KAA0168050.1 hypothetical protein FNF31_00549 [Cafeteria roenbergensis]CAE7718691.1 cap2 [Symbiodinium sp. KB8]|eukprot:KAA0154543.1 hypothetical protein FNF29_02420 [Cafeteria roenbergensis]